MFICISCTGEVFSSVMMSHISGTAINFFSETWHCSNALTCWQWYGLDREADKGKISYSIKDFMSNKLVLKPEARGIQNSFFSKDDRIVQWTAFARPLLRRYSMSFRNPKVLAGAISRTKFSSVMSMLMALLTDTVMMEEDAVRYPASAIGENSYFCMTIFKDKGPVNP